MIDLWISSLNAGLGYQSNNLHFAKEQYEITIDFMYDLLQHDNFF